MYSSLQRLNVVFASALTALFVLLGALALVGNFSLPTDLGVSLEVEDFKLAKGQYDHFARNGGPNGEYAFIQTRIDADLTPLWNWNTKQLYVNLVAEYATANYGFNQVVLWDTIIRDKDDAHLDDVIQSEYPFTDITKKFKKGLDMNITLQWNVVPWVGFMRMMRASEGAATVKVPQLERDTV